MNNCSEIITSTIRVELIENSGNSQLVTNLITILIALIAAIIAIYQVKVNIIASSRIQWIESLRDALSLYCVCVQDIIILVEDSIHESKGKSKEEKNNLVKEVYKEYFALNSQIRKLSLKVKLNLNSVEPDSKRIEEIIDEIDYKINSNKNPIHASDEIAELLNEIIKLSKNIFKDEWEKSKKLFKI